ncbi:hypothetical protein A2U01_0093917, partial [Trifolium medium]|nr:hypothetical protein [Trifolium medium]
MEWVVWWWGKEGWSWWKKKGRRWWWRGVDGCGERWDEVGGKRREGGGGGEE